MCGGALVCRWCAAGVPPDWDREKAFEDVATKSDRLRIQFTHTDSHQQFAASGCSRQP